MKISSYTRSFGILSLLHRTSFTHHQILPSNSSKFRGRCTARPLISFRMDNLSIASGPTTSAIPKDQEKADDSHRSQSQMVPLPGTSVEDSLTSVNPFDLYRKHISMALAKVLEETVQIPAAEIASRLQWTQTQDKGDLNLPIPALKVKGRKPPELALEICERFPISELVEPPRASGGFVQFFFRPGPLTKLVIPTILQEKSTFGSNAKLGLKDASDPSQGRKRIIIEFSSPNIAKPFHAGHLRSTIIGGFLSNLHEAAGWEVIRMNYLGDWGRQFGLLANAFELYGEEEKLRADPIGHLYDIYVQINRDSAPEEALIEDKKKEAAQSEAEGKNTDAMKAELAELEAKSTNEKARKFFKNLEDGDPQALAIWKRFRDLSIEKYKQTYARLNIRYDYYSGESQVEKSYMEAAAKRLKETGVSEISNGAVIVDLTKNPQTKRYGKALIQKRDGSSLYLTRDIGEAVKRHTVYQFDKMIYVVASQQDLHLAQLFKILELMGHREISDKCLHINFGMVLGMSTRRGTVKFLDDILRDVGEKMHEVMQRNESKYQQVDNPEQTADTLGITAVMVQDMTGKRINNYEFSLERMTSFEGDTGPYLQYAHARLCSITRKAMVSPQELETANLSLLTEPHAINLIRYLACWPDVVQNTLKTLEPITVLSYLFKMTHMLSSSYDVLKVMGSEPELKVARMALYEAARQVLHNGMKMLGLNPVERM